MDHARQDFEMSLRECNKVHGFTPVAKGPSRMNEVRNRGKRLNAEIERDCRASRTASVISAEKPRYGTPAKTLRAAEAALAELPHLVGEALKAQQARVNNLVVEATKQNEAYLKAKAGAVDSQAIHSAGGGAARSHG